jgi:hypothetical protein
MRAASFTRVLGARPRGCICFPHEPDHARVYVSRTVEPEMDTVTEPAKVLDPVNTGMLDSTPQPESRVQPAPANYGAREPYPRL